MELTQERLDEIVEAQILDVDGVLDAPTILAWEKRTIAIIEEATGEKVTIVERIIPVRDFLENQDSTSEEEILQALRAQQVCLYDIWDSEPHNIDSSCDCRAHGNYENTLRRLAKSTARRNIAANPGFHWKDDWFFKRLEDGAVQVMHRNKGDYFDVRLVIPASEWASIVCSVSNAGETTPRWEQAQEFHDRVETQSEKGVEPEQEIPEIPEAAIAAASRIIEELAWDDEQCDEYTRRLLRAAWDNGWGGLRK